MKAPVVLQQGLDFDGDDFVQAGEFAGPVLDVSLDGVVTQKINRAGDVVRHDAGKLSAPVVKGDVAHIKYVGGVGVVSGRGVGVDVGR